MNNNRELFSRDQLRTILENKKKRLENMARNPGSRQQERILKEKIALVAADLEKIKLTKINK